jgi:hypothetical protein
LDVGIRVGGARRDGASHLVDQVVDGRTAGLEDDFDVSFHGAGHPLVALQWSVNTLPVAFDKGRLLRAPPAVADPGAAE